MKLLPRAVAFLVAAFVIIGIGVVPDTVRNYFQNDLRVRVDSPTGIDNPQAAELNPVPSRVATERPQPNATISGVDVSITPSSNPKANLPELPSTPSVPVIPTATPLPSPTLKPPPTPSPVLIPAFSQYDLYIHLPPDAAKQAPLPVVVVLHGMGETGENFARSLVQTSDQNGWVLIAPTIPYHDYMNPKTLWEDDMQYTQMLHTTIESLQDRLGIRLQPRVTVYGFSRGAQLAHRFAFFFPDHVRTVVAISAGSYTLPIVKAGAGDTGPDLNLPFGIADFEKTFHYPLNFSDIRKLSFYVAVGADDNKPGEVSRAFDSYVGKDRVERAQVFSNKLKGLGVETKLAIFPNTGHEVTSDMRRDAITFIRERIPPKQ
jgi:predicted esterase